MRLDQVQQAGGGIAPPLPCPTRFKGDKEPLPFRTFYSIITEKFLVWSEISTFSKTDPNALVKRRWPGSPILLTACGLNTENLRHAPTSPSSHNLRPPGRSSPVPRARATATHQEGPTLLKGCHLGYFAM